MPIRLTLADFTKPGWQARRPEEFRSCGMGEALEAFKAYYRRGAVPTWTDGKMHEALGKATAVTKAIGKAKTKLNSIRVAADKRAAQELLTAYEAGIAAFNNAMLETEEEANQRVARLEAQVRQVEAAVEALTIDAI